MMACPHCGGTLPMEKDQPLHFFSIAWATNEKRPWAAQITGMDRKHNVQREFIAPLIDYSKAASFWNRTVDIQFQFVFRVGWIVEVCTNGKRGQTRAFYRVESPTEMVEISAQEVQKWAATR